MRVIIALVALVATGARVLAQEEHSELWYAEARLACLGDATRLCGGYMPDVDRVRACMATKRQQVSAGCAAFYPGGAKEHDED